MKRVRIRRKVQIHFVARELALVAMHVHQLRWTADFPMTIEMGEPVPTSKDSMEWRVRYHFGSGSCSVTIWAVGGCPEEGYSGWEVKRIEVREANPTYVISLEKQIRIYKGDDLKTLTCWGCGIHPYESEEETR